jgi:Lrp/AsnC family transcriptional regulator
VDGGGCSCDRQRTSEAGSDAKVLPVGLPDRGRVFREVLPNFHVYHGRDSTKRMYCVVSLEFDRSGIFGVPPGPSVQESSIVDEIDRDIVRLLQQDGSLSARELGDRVGLTPTPCWRRVRALEEAGVITGRVALVDPATINLDVAALVNIRTNDHSSGWIESFRSAVERFPEIVETYRTSGDIDYTLKVMVPSIAAYDAFYKRLIDAVDLYDVRTIFVMEEIKHTTALPLDYATG